MRADWSENLAVLVTGGAGYIGAITARSLVEAGESVIVLDDFSTGHRKAAALVGGATVVECDCTDRAALDRVLSTGRVDAVMHFAGLTLVADSMQRPLEYITRNFCGTLNLISSMIRYRVPYFVFSSSAATFGIARAIPIDESHPQEPVNPYGWSKKAVEEALLQLRSSGGPASICLRYFNAAGATRDALLGEAHDPETHLIPNVLAAALDGRPFNLFGTDYPTPDGSCVRDFVHVEDLAAAHVLALKAMRGGRESASYNLGNGAGHSIRQVLQAARSVTGSKIEVVEAPRRAGDPPALVASSAKIRKELGWTPRFPEIERIIEDAWRFLRAHPSGY